MKLRPIFYAPLLLGMLSGCGSVAPECGDAKAVDTIKSIISEKIVSKDASSVKRESVFVDGIETVSKDDKLKRSQCQANIAWRLSSESIRLIQALNSPSFEKSQAIFIGLGISQKARFEGLLAGGKSLSNKQIDELKVALYERSLMKETYGGHDPVSVLLGLQLIDETREMINGAIEKEGLEIKNGDLVNLSKQKLSYTIRPDEDKQSAGKKDFIVEVKYSSQAAEIIAYLESLPEIEKAGIKVIADRSKAASTQPQIATPPSPPASN